MSDGIDTNYFVCTLGQATVINKDQNPVDNINDFIDHQGQNKANLPAVGFPLPGNEGSTEWTHQLYTFQDIWKGSAHVAEVCRSLIKSENDGQATVALLCPSTSNFLFMWLGLIRLGHAVLLIAPQCQPAAIAHLCRACGVTTLFYDDFYKKLALESVDVIKADGEPDFAGLPLPIETTSDEFQEALKQPNESISKSAKVSGSVVGYLHHTSGTSTGLPKPIPQTHYAGLGVLPRFSDGNDKATFTTTPLYHGGVADTFRAWAGNAMIWLFPGKGIPITAKNIVSCLVLSQKEHRESGRPPVKYFASVPYVLQMMAADTKGLQNLINMDIVGVGGAALPAEVGDDLVAKGVNLISRFGSAECGFLMSSHRDYSKDNEWQYLRSNPQIQVIDFEARDDGNSELVVLPSWPHRVSRSILLHHLFSYLIQRIQAKTNRDNGSFASADLFTPHPSIPNAWRYHSRADSQLTLITGKKFDPAPLESAIATSTLLDDVLIFGNGRPFPGALLFRSVAAEDMSSDDLIAALAATVEKLNAESQDHARLPRNMLVPMVFGESKLQKSSKGTILRGKAEEVYADDIEAAYARLFTAGVGGDVADAEVAETIQSAIERIVGDKAVASKPSLTHETDLFAYGVDSVASIQIRYTLKQLLPVNAEEPPLSIVEDCGSIGKLTEFILARRRGETFQDDSADGELDAMRDLVEEFSDFTSVAARAVAEIDNHSSGTASATEDVDHKAHSPGQVIVLTGATGALGAHILNIYRADPTVSHIYCLVRGATPTASRERVSKSLAARGLEPLTSSFSSSAKVTVLQASLGDALLGLNPPTYALLARTVNVVMHLAWAVNFRMRLASFKADHISGLRNLLALAASPLRDRDASTESDNASAGASASAAGNGNTNEKAKTEPPVFAFCSSVASVIASAPRPSNSEIPERISTDPNDASPLGYSRSKWVAEGICAAAACRAPSLRNRVGVFRVGQLAGDTVRGAWNANEAYPLMLGSVRATGCLPALEEVVGWLPVDVAAKAMVEGARALEVGWRGGGGEGVEVFHVLNPHSTPTFKTLLAWLATLEGRGMAGGEVAPFEILPPAEWIARMDKLQEEQPEHPALRLLGLWRGAYGSSKGGGESVGSKGNDDEVNGKKEDRQVFSQKASKIAAPVLKDVGPVNAAYFGKLWRWIVKEVVQKEVTVDGQGMRDGANGAKGEAKEMPLAVKEE